MTQAERERWQERERARLERITEEKSGTKEPEKPDVEAEKPEIPTTSD